MSENNDQLRRRNPAQDWNLRRFEQEVAEEIGLSRQRDRQYRNQLGRGGPEATFMGPKSNRETGNYTSETNRTGRQRQR